MDLVFQIRDSLSERLESTKLDGVFSILETSDGTLGDSGAPREKLGGELFCFYPDFFQIPRVNYSLVLTEPSQGHVVGVKITTTGTFILPSTETRDAPQCQYRVENDGRPQPNAREPQAQASIREKCGDSDVIEQHGCNWSSRHGAMLVVPRPPADQAQRQ